MDMIEKAGTAMMRAAAGRKLTREFTGAEIAGFARAVLTALREPSEAMWSAGTDTLDGGGANAERVWQAMIDAALTESKAPGGVE